MLRLLTGLKQKGTFSFWFDTCCVFHWLTLTHHDTIKSILIAGVVNENYWKNCDG